MRTMVLTIALLPLSGMLFSQGVFSNNTSGVLEKVIQDYPYRFHNIKGDLIAQGRQAAEYKSTVQIPGSSSCVVSRYMHSSDEEYSWTCTVLESKDFENAKIAFRDVFDQIRNSIIKMNGDQHFILSGQYEAPLEDRRMTHILFTLLPGMKDIKKLKVDLSIQSVKKQWRICISVYDHDPATDAEGAITGN